MVNTNSLWRIEYRRFVRNQRLLGGMCPPNRTRPILQAGVVMSNLPRVDGPEWMSDSKCWPVQQVFQACEASREEVKV